MAADALVFVPGIKGTKLVDTNRPSFDTIWSGVQSNFETIENLELSMAYKQVYYDENIRTIIRAGEIESLAYAEFLRDLKTSKPVFIFNYDWRLSAQENGEKLAEFVEFLFAKSRASASTTRFKKLDFITHSLGNFILRNYLLHHGFARVNKIVFTVPPFKGSIDIVGAALVGEGWFPEVKSKIRKIIRTMPGALELLPKYTGASRFSDGSRHNFYTFKHWQGNVTAATSPMPGKLKKALATARRTVQSELLDLATLEEAERSRILVICRDGYETFQSIIVEKNGPGGLVNFVDFDGACRNGNGDGRVPHVSSCCYFDSVLTLMVGDAFWYKDYSHGFVLKDERVQKLVNRFLFGTFNYEIPGGTIRKVVGLERKVDSQSGLPYWAPVT